MVAGGYVMALLLAGVAVYIRVLNTQGPDAQASAGMYAFGDSLLFLAVLTVAAIVPTAFALYFLRSSRKFWTGLSIVAVAIALTGASAALLVVLAPHQPSQTLLGSLVVFGILRLLLAPSFALIFLMSALFAPARQPRRILLAATMVEGVAAGYAAVEWFVRPLLGNLFHTW